MARELSDHFPVVEKWFSEGKILDTPREDLLNYLQICVMYGHAGRHLGGDPNKHTLIANTIIFLLNEKQSKRLQSKMEDLKIIADQQKIIASQQEEQSKLLVTESKKITDLTQSMVDESIKLTELTKTLGNDTVILKNFTKGVFWLTIVLAVLTLLLVAVEVPEYVSKMFFHHD